MDSREARDLMASRQEEENRELKAENKRLREALQPLADVAELVDAGVIVEVVGDRAGGNLWLIAGDAFRARDALAEYDKLKE